MYKNILAVFAVVFSLAFGPAVFADSWQCGEGLKEMVGDLKLDNTQKEKIKPILEQLKSTIHDNVVQMKDVDAQMKQQMTGNAMDESTMNGLIDKKANLIGNMIKAKWKAKMEIIPILNEEQKSQLKNKMNKLEEKMAEKYKSCHNDD